MKKALRPPAAKAALEAAIIKALGLKQGTKLDIEEKTTDHIKTFKMSLPGNPSHSVGFNTYHFPGCCKYGIISQLYTIGTMRGKKLSPHVLNWALAQISADGYSKAVGTTSNSSNSSMEEVLKKTGWKRIDRGVNSNTDNIVSMWVHTTGKTRKEDTFMNCD